ncbi:MAG: hypothetical protein AAF081_16135 [Actinomycetota bacterium]
MATTTGGPVGSNRALLSIAAIFVVLYALAAAWIVIADGEAPPSLALHRTDDGQGVVISGAVPDAEQQQALVDAVGEVTGAPIVVVEITVDPDAASVDPAIDTAMALVAELPPDPEG